MCSSTPDSRKQLTGQKINGGRSRASKRAKALVAEITSVTTSPKKKLMNTDIVANILSKSEVEEKQLKTGTELRKFDREKKQKNASKLKKNALSKNEFAKKSAKNDNKVRFRLGCGIEALTSETLITLVQSTAPYLFPGDNTK